MAEHLHFKKSFSFNVLGCKRHFYFKNNITPMINFKHSKCLKCNKKFCYKFFGYNIKYCNLHNQKELTNNVKCLYCDKNSTNNFPGYKPKYCKDHSKMGMIDLVTPKCINCDNYALFTVTNINGYFCNIHIKQFNPNFTMLNYTL